MTRVIGKPKPPKRGATFGDVPFGPKASTPADSMFLNRNGVPMLRVSKDHAKAFGQRDLFEYGQGDPVTLLSREDPEPDPDVCTYGELNPGTWFVADDQRSRLLRRTNIGHLDMSGQHWRPGMHESRPVRRVPAGVVVHEKPGTHVYADGGGARIQFWRGGEPEYTRSVSLEQLQAIVQQGAALLAAAEREGQSEPTEDRSKPAPGWDVVPKATDYEVSSSDTSIPPWMRFAKGGFATRADATAWTWAQHDAQQAGEGGGS